MQERERSAIIVLVAEWRSSKEVRMRQNNAHTFAIRLLINNTKRVERARTIVVGTSSRVDMRVIDWSLAEGGGAGGLVVTTKGASGTGAMDTVLRPGEGTS